MLYVWDHFVSKAAAKNVFIMAHSYGGLSFVELVSVFVFHLSFLPPTDNETHTAFPSVQSQTLSCYKTSILHLLHKAHFRFAIPQHVLTPKRAHKPFGMQNKLQQAEQYEPRSP